MYLILTVLAVFLVLVVCELYWRRKNLHGEFIRKFVHISVGSFVAFWPYYLSPNEIKVLSVAFLLVVGASKYLKVFQAIHSVQRPTLGELWFALIVGLLAFTLQYPHIFTAAILTMSLADGFAAVVGTRFGNQSRYVVFGATKSMVGTVTFAVVTAAILVGYDVTTPGGLIGFWLVPIALVATLIENIALKGSDNLLVPLWIAAALYLLT